MNNQNRLSDLTINTSHNHVNNSLSEDLTNKFELNGAIVCYPKFVWTTNYFIEQVYLCMIKARDKDGITRRYEKRAKWFLRRINLWDSSPEFIIYRKDFSKRVYQELIKYKRESPITLNYVITSALEDLFESIQETDEPVFDGDYYLMSKKYKLLKWRFDREDDQESDLDSKYDINYPLYDNAGIEIGEILDRHNSAVVNKKKKIGVFHQIVI
jgi:hypothetical protein